jgi:hypothetical protein
MGAAVEAASVVGVATDLLADVVVDVVGALGGIADGGCVEEISGILDGMIENTRPGIFLILCSISCSMLQIKWAIDKKTKASFTEFDRVRVRSVIVA